jgi:hypothetical protein
VTARARYPWAYTTAARSALDFAFDVQTTDAQLGRFLDHVFGVLTLADGEAVTKPTRFGLAEIPASAPDSDTRFVVRRGHRSIEQSKHPSFALERLFAEVNRATVRASGHRLVVHAGLVGFGDRAVMLVGASGAGKSSLTGMLCVLGAAYGTDELTAVDLETGTVEGAHRPIVLKPSAPNTLLQHVPAAPTGIQRYLRLFRPVAPGDLGARPIDGTPRNVTVVFVRYSAGGPPAALEPIARAEAVAALYSSCWNRRALGRAAFDAVVALVRSADVTQLEFSDCLGAAQTIRNRVEKAS